MDLFADAWFARGHGHRVCEDYALARVDGGRAQVALCDGCSGSPDTDLGARLLARAAMAGDTASAATHAAALGLPVESLDATLAELVGDEDTVRASLSGDGLLAARRRDGRLATWRVTFPSGAPAYLAHDFEPTRRAAWCDAFGDARRVHHVGFDGRVTVTEQPGYEPLTWRLPWDRDDLDLVAVFSDGADAFDAPDDSETSRARVPVPAEAVVAALMAVSHPQTPRFAERRLRRFLERTCPSRGWRPNDDISVAMIGRGPACA